MFKKLKRKRKINRNRSLTGSGHWTLAEETKRGVLIVILFTLSFFSLLSFFQATGSAGETITSALGQVFGWADWIVPILLLVLTYYLVRPGTYDVKAISYLGFALILLGYTGLLHLSVRNLPIEEIITLGKGGGYLGWFVGGKLYEFTALGGALTILLAMLLSGAFIFFNTSFTGMTSFWDRVREKLGLMRFKKDRDNEDESETDEEDMDDDEEGEDEEDMDDDEEDEIDAEDTEDDTPAPPRAAPVKKPKRKVFPKIDLPLNLLTSAKENPVGGDVKANSKKIQETLASFGIEVTMGEINVGPTVTQYTLKPYEGVKLNQITALQSDLALALAAHPIRIEAPIPGKSLVGIEMPNQSVSMVKLRAILESAAYKNRKTNLMLSLGKDVTGKALLADLTKMPHLLIAGATGSGKSVAINCMITSLLYQNSPDLLKLILVDPKRVELSVYDGIPHLVAPVITDVDKTINALRWAVGQMDERYKLLAAAGKKNIESYNNSRLVEKMPYIVIVIDELADLMMVAAKEVESAIIRLSQMARAVGIHLILATQRPSVNVITGLIKANITSRIAFSVASVTDSRTIIDSSGAEKLLGNGDMLFISAELSKPKRIQGAYISEEETADITKYLKDRGEPEYESAVTERRQNLTGGGGGFAGDGEEEDLQTAVEVVVKAKRASATLLQSRMRIGFAKASRILDLLEERGIIGPQNSSKPREVLITEEELKQGLLPGGTTDEEVLDDEEYAAAYEDAHDSYDEDESGEEDDNELEDGETENSEESDEGEETDEEYDEGDDEEDYEEEDDEDRR